MKKESMRMKKDIRAYEYEELQKELERLGEKPFRAKQIYEWLHVKLADRFDEMTNLSVKLRESLRKNMISFRYRWQSGSSRNWTERTSFCSVCMTETWWKAFLCGISTVIRYVFPRRRDAAWDVYSALRRSGD